MDHVKIHDILEFEDYDKLITEKDLIKLGFELSDDKYNYDNLCLISSDEEPYTVELFTRGEKKWDKLWELRMVMEVLRGETE